MGLIANTFSIVARDPDAQEWAVGAASKFLAIGSVTPWARAGVGAIATQSHINTTFGPDGLELLAQGVPVHETLDRLIASDEGREKRQVGIIDAEGNTATFTGSECNPWAGALTGKNYACQGNLLAGEAVIADMASSFERSEGPLAWRVMDALEAAELAGGDKRGKQAAAILVVREGRGYGGFNDRMVDYRVDDHAEPLAELARILALKNDRAGFKKP